MVPSEKVLRVHDDGGGGAVGVRGHGRNFAVMELLLLPLVLLLLVWPEKRFAALPKGQLWSVIISNCMYFNVNTLYFFPLFEIFIDSAFLRPKPSDSRYNE